MPCWKRLCTARSTRWNGEAFTVKSPKPWKRFPETVERQPELLALHCTEAGLIDKAVGYWFIAALRSRERSANVEAIAQLTKGLSLLDTLPLSTARDARELELLGPLGTAYIASRGSCGAGSRPSSIAPAPCASELVKPHNSSP
jgi:hypothetical protein